MSYPAFPDFNKKIEYLTEYARLKHEYGADPGCIAREINAAASALEVAIKKIIELENCKELRKKEPDDYGEILKLRPDGPRRIWLSIDEKVFADKLAGAFIGRAAGCTLGAPVEFWSVEAMESWAAHVGDAFPPTDYWSAVPYPFHKRYGKSPCSAYTRGGLDGIPVDDDLAYTLLGLLIMEDYGPDFSIADAGAAWLKYLPYACTAEDVALRNMRNGIAAEDAADFENPYCQWIGADIRSDPWGYLAPGWPEKAAEFAYRDAYLSHRRNGVYGEMFFSAVISAAFTTANSLDAVKIGLTEIPAECALYKDVEWALDAEGSIKNYKKARSAVDKRFEGQSGVHTNLNACLTVFGLSIGGGDFTKVISETVAMGQDNDCTAATAGSVAGAVLGKDAIPKYWYKNFNNKVESYLIGNDSFALDGLLARFEKQAKLVHSMK